MTNIRYAPLQMSGSKTESTNHSCCSHNILVVIIVDEEEERFTRVAQLKINLLPDGWLRQAWDELRQEFFSLKIICKTAKTILDKNK